MLKIGFSLHTSVKTTYRNRVNVEAYMRISCLLSSQKLKRSTKGKQMLLFLLTFLVWEIFLVKIVSIWHIIGLLTLLLKELINKHFQL